MTWWRFTSLADCDAAQDAATLLLPHDRLVDGVPAPAQITTRWAVPTALGDGTLAFPAYPGMDMPAGAVEVADDDVAALMPGAS